MIYPTIAYQILSFVTVILFLFFCLLAAYAGNQFATLVSLICLIGSIIDCIKKFAEKLYVNKRQIEKTRLFRNRKVILLSDVKRIERKIINNAEVVDLFNEKNKKIIRVHMIYKNAYRFEEVIEKRHWEK